QAYYGEAVPESELIFARARSCIEDLAMFGVMRRATLGEPWLSSQRVEKRLLRRVDALIACGAEAYPRLGAMLVERPMPDPDLTWAHLFYCGSIAGEDSLAELMRIAQSADLEEAELLVSVADALALAPHPGIERWMRGWLA